MKRAQHVKIFMLVGILFTLIGCATQQAIKNDSHNYKAIAIASCTDLTNMGTAAMMAADAAKAILQNQKDQADFINQVDPVASQVADGIKIYCETAQLVNDVDGWNALVSKQADVLKLVRDIDVLVTVIRNGNAKQAPSEPPTRVPSGQPA
ncbi:MAG: hypothetical protein HQK58_14190 [Deltaproteobacteria bacterium]|nr:hypothetical protein [Deltaproteobacteria bacterium]